MRVICILILLISHLFNEVIAAQDTKSIRKNFAIAETYFLNEDYEKAAEIYNELVRVNPDNTNIHFLLGTCFLGISGSRDKAVIHLQEAVSSITHSYREGSPRETKAPEVALFALARAYHICRYHEEAIEFYEKYKETLKKSRKKEIEYVNKQIASIELLNHYSNYSLESGFSILSEAWNSRGRIRRAVFAEMDSIMVFMINDQNQPSLMITSLENGKWKQPENITDQLKIKGKYDLCSVTSDGKTLYLSVKRNFNWDLFVSYYEDGNWTPIKELPGGINTRRNETHVIPVPGKNALYFTSDRPGGIGDMDIYYVEQNPAGKWNKPVNLGEPVNTIYSEETPFITADNKTIFFSSQYYDTFGGYDIFYSVKNDDDTWSGPVNLGYPVNTADDDLFFIPLGNGEKGIYSPTAGLLPEGKIIEFDIEFDNDKRIFAIRWEKDNNNKNALYKVLSDVNKDFTRNNEYPDAEDIPENNLKSNVYVNRKDQPGMLSNNILKDEEKLSTGTHDDIKQIQTHINDVIKTSYPKVSLNKGPYTIQFLALKSPLMTNKINLPDHFQQIKGADGIYRYITGSYKRLSQARTNLTGLVNMGFSDAFVNNISNYKIFTDSVDASGRTDFYYTVQMMTSMHPIDMNHFKIIDNIVFRKGEDGIYRYTTGRFIHRDDAEHCLQEIKNKGYIDAFILKIPTDH